MFLTLNQHGIVEILFEHYQHAEDMQKKRTIEVYTFFLNAKQKYIYAMTSVIVPSSITGGKA